MSVGGVTTADMAAAGSDDSGDSDFFNSSLSIWRGPRSSLEGEYEPVSLDLHTACSIGNFDVVRMYINSEEDLNAKNSGGYTPLMYAAYIGHDNVVNMLIDAQVDVNLSNDKGHTPLMLAASCGNESVCEFLKDAGADLEAQDKKGWTALFHATFNGHQNLVKFLLERGANINAMEPKYGFTPLMQAAFHGHEIIAQCLLQQGANMELTSRIGDTAGSLAMKKGFIKIVSMIDNKALSHVSLRSDASLGSDDSSSDETNPNSSRLRKGRKGPSIAEGPEAINKLRHPYVTFQDPVVTESPQRAPKQPHPPSQGMSNPVPPFQNLSITGDDSRSAQRRPTKPTNTYRSQHQPVGAATVVQVSPSPKVSVGRPTNLHDLLIQLGLSHYEQKFVDQEVNLEVFLTLSADDLKEIGLDKFGPRRKMTNAIESWQKETAMLSGGDSGADTSSMSNHVEKLQIELQEKNRQLSQAFQQLHNYHKDLQDEKNIRSLTENYLLTEKARLDDFILQCRDSKAHCGKALRCHGKVKTIKQLLRARHEEAADVGFIPPRLQETLQLTDEATKKQITGLANKSSTELWDTLQAELQDGCKSVNMAMFNLTKACSDEHASNY